MEETKTTEVIEETEETKRIAELEAEVKNLKNTLSEKNSENARRKRETEEWKQKYNSTLDESQRKENEREEKEKEREELLQSLIREKELSQTTAKFLEVGYSGDMAKKAAEAVMNGDISAITESIGTFMESKTKEIEENLLKKQPELTNGNPLGQKEIDDAEMQRMRKYAGL